MFKSTSNMKIEDNTFTSRSEAFGSDGINNDYFESYNNIELTDRSKIPSTGRRTHSPTKNFQTRDSEKVSLLSSYTGM